jgi:hypothetical protein
MSEPLDEGREEGPPPPDEPGRGDESSVGDAPMRASITSVLIVGLIFAVVGFGLGGLRTGFGVALGGAIAAANLWVFARVGNAFVSKKGNTAPWGVIALLKMLLLFGGVWLILRTGVVSALSLVAGYAALPIGITVASLFGPSPRGSDDAQTPPAQRGRNVVKGPPR